MTVGTQAQPHGKLLDYEQFIDHQRMAMSQNNFTFLGNVPVFYWPVLATNLEAPFVLIQRLLPALMGARGAVINVTSDAGVTGYPGWGAYGISKFGLEGLSQTWAAELAESGVRLNWVDPGSMNTAMHRAAEPEEDELFAGHRWAEPNHDHLRQQMREVFRDSKESARRAERSRSDVLRQFDWTAVLPEWIRNFRRLLS